jgi:hypothetical protein
MKRYEDMLFQECPFYVKLWRLRHYIAIPFLAFQMWVRAVQNDTNNPNTRMPYLPFRDCWDIQIGLAQVRMNWLHEFKDREEDLNT